MTIKVGDEFVFYNVSEEDDPLNGQRVTVVEIDDSRITQVAYGDVLYRVRNYQDEGGLAFGEELHAI